ncbi:unnamed protein product [Prunus armeniaca]
MEGNFSTIIYISFFKIMASYINARVHILPYKMGWMSAITDIYWKLFVPSFMPTCLDHFGERQSYLQLTLSIGCPQVS